jgi:hypothetical protein
LIPCAINFLSSSKSLHWPCSRTALACSRRTDLWLIWP